MKYGMMMVTTGGQRIEQRDIVLIPFPFSNLTNSKRRPTLVLSNQLFNSRLVNDFIVCAITGREKATQYSIEIKQEDIEEGYLRKPSILLPDKLITIHQSVILAKWGRLTNEKNEEVNEVIQKIIEVD